MPNHHPDNSIHRQAKVLSTSPPHSSPLANIFHLSPLNNPLLEFIFHKFLYIYILMQTNSPPQYNIMFSMVFLHASILLGKYQA